MRLFRAPMIPLALAAIAGVVLGRYVPLTAGLWIAAAAAGLVAAGLTVRRQHLHVVAACGLTVAAVALSALNARQAYYSPADDDIVTYTGGRAMLATVRGRIESSPLTIDDEGGSAAYRRPARTSFVLRADGVQTGQEWTSVSGMVRVTIRQADGRLRAGQRVEIVGRMGRVQGPDNPGQFDGAELARREGTPCWVSAEDGGAVTILGAQDAWWQQALWNVRSAARQHMTSLGDGNDGRLLNALITGERHPALRELNQAMVRCGIAHFLSVSGQHLAIFLGMAFLLCRLGSVRPSRAAWVVLVLLAAYMLLAEPNPPLLRSAIMAGALCAATIVGRPHSALNAIAVAMVVLLIAWPLELFSAGFQLSFGIVAGMIVLYGPMKALLMGRWLRVRGLIVYRGRGSRWRWVRHEAFETVASACVMSLTAYVVSAPLVAYHFGLLSVYAAPLSLLLGPLAVLILVPGYLSLALAWPMPNLAAVIGQLADWSARLLTRAVAAAQHLPGLAFELRPVSIGWVVACYALLAAVLLRRRLPRRGLVIGAMVLAVAGLTAQSQWPAAAPACAEVNVLDVGAGQCVLLRTPSGRTYLLDTGSLTDGRMLDRTLLPFIRDGRLASPTGLFVSHGNSDHFNAMAGLLDRGRPEWLATSELFATQKDLPVTGRELLDQCRAVGVPHVTYSAGQVIDLDERTRLEVLWPPADAAEMRPKSKDGSVDANDTSLVLRLTCDGRRMLLPGDAEEAELSALLKLAGVAKTPAPAKPSAATRPRVGPNVATAPSAPATASSRPAGLAPLDLRADVLILPHHGGWSPSLEEFVRAVGPKVVIVSNSHEPRPPVDAAAAQRFYSRLPTSWLYYSTVRNGWIQVRLGSPGTQVETMR